MTQNNIPQTPEAIAFSLMERIFKLEGKFPDATGIQGSGDKSKYPTRQEMLDTYKQCIQVVKYSPKIS